MSILSRTSLTSSSEDLRDNVSSVRHGDRDSELGLEDRAVELGKTLATTDKSTAHLDISHLIEVIIYAADLQPARPAAESEGDGKGGEGGLSERERRNQREKILKDDLSAALVAGITEYMSIHDESEFTKSQQIAAEMQSLKNQLTRQEYRYTT